MNLNMPMKQETEPTQIAGQSRVHRRFITVRHRFIGGSTHPNAYPSPAVTPPISTQLTAISGITFFIVAKSIPPTTAKTEMAKTVGTPTAQS
jgi:hypothetical protein